MSINSNRVAKIIKTSFKHGVVSVICGSIEYFLFLFMYSILSLPLIFSYVIPYGLATVVGYFFHNFFTFKLKQVGAKSSIFYLIQSLLVLMIGFSIIKALLFVNIAPEFAKILQLFITFIFNVAFGRYVTFKKNF